MQELDFQAGIATLTKRFADLLDQNLNPVLLIDGRAGSGKSTFAQILRDEIFRLGDGAPHLIHMDDLYPGWEGLRAGSSYLLQQVLKPLPNPISYQKWDWEKGNRGVESDEFSGWRHYQPGTGLIVEGCGSLSRATKELAALSVWIECDAATRKKRWHQRDGNRFDEYWPIWELQEDEFYELEHSSQLADLVIRS